MNDALPPWLDAPLQALLADTRPRHALLLHGPAGCGKGLLARALAAATLCEARAPVTRACGRCAACGWFAQGSHPDFRLVTPEAEEAADTPEDGVAAPATKRAKASKFIRLAQIQALAGFAAVGGHRGAARVVLIEPADTLNHIAANALLKLLEEPPAGFLFLLVTDQPARLLPTLRSRCRAAHLPAPPRAQALAWLGGQGVPATDAAPLLAVAGGGPLAALESADDARVAVHRGLLDAIASLPETPAQEVAERLEGLEAVRWLPVLQRWLTDVARVAAGAAPLAFPDRTERLGRLAARTTPGGVARADSALRHLRPLATHPLTPRLFADDAIAAYLDAYAPQGRAR